MIAKLSVITIIVLFLFPTLLYITRIGYAHVEKEGTKPGEEIVVSKYTKGNMDLTTNPESKQWKESSSSEIDIRSIGGHTISVNSLNNGTYLFFLLSWDDNTQNAANNNNHTDGAAVIFELPKEEAATTATFIANSSIDHNKHQQQQQHGVLQYNISNVKDGNNIWLWSTSTSDLNNLSNKGVISRAEWKSSQWHVLIGRPMFLDSTSSTANNNGEMSFKNGILEKDFIKFAVWDGEKGESVDQVLRANENDKLMPHADFVLLPSLNTHPQDVYLWSAILIVGVVLFVMLEKRLHKNRSSRYTQEREENSKGVFP